MSERGKKIGSLGVNALAGVGMLWDFSRFVQALYYNNVTPSGLWNDSGELVTVVGNHFTRMAVETPPGTAGVILNILGIGALLYTGLQAGRAVGEFVRPRSSKSTRRSGTTS